MLAKGRVDAPGNFLAVQNITRILVTKIGRENVIVKIVFDGLSSEKASLLEIERIIFSRVQGVMLVNRSNGGESGYGAHIGVTFTQEHRAALSASKTGRKRPAFTDETIDRMSRAATA